MVGKEEYCPFLSVVIDSTVFLPFQNLRMKMQMEVFDTLCVCLVKADSGISLFLKYHPCVIEGGDLYPAECIQLTLTSDRSTPEKFL